MMEAMSALSPYALRIRSIYDMVPTFAIVVSLFSPLSSTTAFVNFITGMKIPSALLTQPAIDASNHKVDKETRRVSVNRTIAKIIAGTGVGMFVVRGPIYKGILSMTNIKGNSKFSKALLPKKYLKELNDNPKFLKNYRSALAMAIALLAMCVTNFVLDAPLTAMLTNYLNEKTEEKKHE